jgi:hypothetical protein
MKFLSTGFIAVFVFISSSYAQNGGRGGGNLLAAEFSDVATETFSLAARAQEEINLDGKIIRFENLQKIVEAMKVTVSEAPLFLEGKSVDAINDPSLQEITFYAERWRGFNLDDRRRLVVHEVLGLARIHDLSYQSSEAILKLSSKITRGGDSTWLLCDNGALVVNSVEHRSGSEGRETDLVLIIGMHRISGKLVDAEGFVRLRSQDNQGKFYGKISINYKTRNLSMRGVLDLEGSMFQIDRKLACRQMNFRDL